MKTFVISSVKFLSIAVVMAGFVAHLESVSHAATVFSTSFEQSQGYSVGPLGSQGGWTSTTGASVVNAIPDLVVNGQNGGDQALQLTTPNSDNAAVHALAAQTGTVYLGFLFRYDAGTISSNDFLGLWVDNGVGTSDAGHTNVPNFGLKADQGPSLTDYFLRLSGTGGSYATTQAAIGTAVELVVKLSKTGGPSSAYNQMTLWVNPTSEASTSFAGSGSTTLTTISRLGFRTANLSTGDRLLVDNLRVGTTFDSVHAVPLPASLGLLLTSLPGLVGVGWIIRRSKTV